MREEREPFNNVFIVGAGFSFHAGLPLTGNFTRALLDVSGLKEDGPSTLQVNLLKDFVRKAFKHATNADAKYWPYLEDIFTTIDLSANTGHHLGPDFSPSQLRTLRRALIVRIIRMLSQRYKRRLESPDDDWNALETFFSLVETERSAFLSMNWDTVIEEGLKRMQGIARYDYGCDATSTMFVDNDTRLEPWETKGEKGVSILKPHGSANWLYCDACRRLFWVTANKTELIASQLFKLSDWEVVNDLTEETYMPSRHPFLCPACKADALGTRFATFSYRKALDFPMYESSWRAAERYLTDAQTWTFIGYSLPAADYEFKFLLKRVELARNRAPHIVLVLGGEETLAEQTRKNYQKFFGPKLKKSSPTVFMDGLDKKATRALQKLNILRDK